MITAILSGPNTDALSLSGALDAEGALALRPVLETLVSTASRDIVLDVSDVDSMDGSGVGAIAFLFKRLAARGLAVRLTGAKGQPLALLRRLGLDRTLGIERAERPRRLDFVAALGLARAA